MYKISMNEGVVKMIKFSNIYKLMNFSEISLFLLLLNYNKFELEILYRDEIGYK
jgi:hypothetical protein